jgi:hypothetical protein
MKFALAVLVLTLATPLSALACKQSPEAREAAFKAVDTNGDGTISYAERYTHERKGLDEAKKNISSPTAQKLEDWWRGVKRPAPNTPEDMERVFTTRWAAIPKDKSWSKEEYLQETQTKRCRSE